MPERYKKCTGFNYFNICDIYFALHVLFFANKYFYTPFQYFRPALGRHKITWATERRRQAWAASSLLAHYWMDLDVWTTEGRHQGRHWAACSWTAGHETAIKDYKWTTLVNFSGLRRQGFFFFLAQGDRVFLGFFLAQGDRAFFFSGPRRQGFFFSGPRRQGFFFFWPKETVFFFWPKETALFLFSTWTRIRLCLRNLPFVVQEVQTPLHHARQALQVGYIGHCLTGP